MHHIKYIRVDVLQRRTKAFRAGHFLNTVGLLTLIHRESKKGCHPNHGYNFVNS